MGYVKHDVIVVTSYDRNAVEAALIKATEFSLPVTNITNGIINEQYTFVVVPDGSKEGWKDSEDMDIARDCLLSWLNDQAFDDHSNKYDFIGIRFGGDDSSLSIYKGD